MTNIKHFIGIFIGITVVVAKFEVSARSVLISSQEPTLSTIQNANGYEFVRTINIGRSIFQPQIAIASPHPYMRPTGMTGMEIPTFYPFNQGRSEPFQAQPPLTQLPQPFSAYRSNPFVASRHVGFITDPSYYYYRAAMPLPAPAAPSQTIYYVRNPVYMSRGFFDNFLSFFGISSKDSEESESVHEESKEPKPVITPEASPTENDPAGNVSIIHPEVRPEKKPETVEETTTIKEVHGKNNVSVQPLPPMDNNWDRIHEAVAPDNSKVHAAVPDKGTTEADLPVSTISFTFTETSSKGPLTEAGLMEIEPLMESEPEITELTSVVESESEIESEPEIPENEIPQETQGNAVVEKLPPDATDDHFAETTEQEPSVKETAVIYTSTEKPVKAANVSTVEEGSKTIENSVKPQEKITPGGVNEKDAPMGAKNTTNALEDKAYTTTTEKVDVRPQEAAVTTVAPTTSQPAVEDFNVIPEP